MVTLRKTMLFVFLLFLFFSLTKNIFDYQKTVSFYQSYKNDYEKEKKTNITLQTKILKNNDPNEIEKTIRDKLNLIKKNEVAVIIPQPTPTPVITTPTLPPIYRQWFNLFFQN